MKKNDNDLFGLPLVSVIMPVYNTKEQYLREAIESILAQTYQKFELIIIDDGSAKPLEPIVHSYKDARIKYKYLPKNRGASVARNIGFHLSSGEYIAVQDSDDISYPDRLKVQVEYMRKYPKVGVLGGQYNVMSANKNEETVVNKFGSPEYLSAYALFVNSPFGHSTVMMRRSVLVEKMIHYDSSVVCDDFKLFMDLLDGTEFMNIPRVLVGYRWHKDNISHQKAEKLMNDVCNVRVNMWKKDLNLTDENTSLLKRFMMNETLSAPELRKAGNIFKSVVFYYAKKYHNPRMAEMMVKVLNEAYQKQNLSKQEELFSVKDNKVYDHTKYRLSNTLKRKIINKRIHKNR